MPVTSPDNVAYPSTSWVAGIIAAIAALATSIQTALTKRQRYDYNWADSTARTAQAGMISGSTGWQADTEVEYTYVAGAWVISGGKTPLIVVNRGSTQSITGGAYALVSAAYASPSINLGFTSFTGGALTIATNGWYRVTVYTRWVSTVTGIAFQVTKNSTSIDTTATIFSDVRISSGGSFITMGGSSPVLLSATDVLRLYVYTVSTQNLGTATNDVLFSVEWLHA